MTSRRFILLTLICLASVYGQDTDTDHHDEEEEHSEPKIWVAIAITTFAGCAAFLGALSIFCIKQNAISTIVVSLSFSSGVLIYLCFMNLIPESMELFNHATDHENEALSHFYTLLSVCTGILISLTVENLLKKMGVHVHQQDINENPVELVAVVDTDNNNNNNDNDPNPDPDPIREGLISDATNRNKLSHVSYAVAGGLILHHFPEGIATFISLYYDLHFGLLVAFGLAVHDIPSGICIAVPTYCTTGSKFQPFLLCFIAASIYPIGAFVGWAIVVNANDQFIDIFMGILFGITGGVLLYIGFIELLPTALVSAYELQAQNKTNKKSDSWYKNHILTISSFLMFIGFLIMDISNIILKASGGHGH